MNRIFIFLLVVSLSLSSFGQQIDSTQIGKEYPYILPILGKKAYARGYSLQKPFGAMLSSIFNKQGIILEDFELALQGPSGNLSEYYSLDGILDFGPSEGRIMTANARVDAWILPFFAVGGYYGNVWGEQTITFSLLGNENLIESVTDINGKYYGLNLLAIVPLGPVNLAADYSWSWTTNDRLDNPVLVKVSGMRLIKQIPTKTKGRFWAVWGGAQFQNLDNRTSGNIGFDEALGISEEAKQEFENTWNSFTNGEIPNGDGQYWDDLSALEKAKHTATYGLVTGLVNTDVYYKFNKKLEYDWNMLLGANFQLSPEWQFRAEYGFLKSKQQVMISANYRFGF